MGTVISASKFLTENPASLSKPFIYCCPYEDLESEAFSIGRALAKELIAIQPNRRTMKLEKCFKNVICVFYVALTNLMKVNFVFFY